MFDDNENKFENDSERQKYLSDLKRLKKIQEAERTNRKKSSSKYIDDYYYGNGDDYDDYYDQDDYDYYEDYRPNKKPNRSSRDYHDNLYIGDSNKDYDKPNPRNRRAEIDYNSESNRRKSNKVQSGLKLADISRKEPIKELIREPIIGSNSEVIKEKPRVNAKRNAVNAEKRQETKAKKVSSDSKSKQTVKPKPKTGSTKKSDIKNLGSDFADNVRQAKKKQVEKVSKKAKPKPEKKAKPKSRPKKGMVKRFFSNVVKVCIVLILIGAGFLAYSFYNKQEGYYTIAIFGVDNRDGVVGKGALADMNMICNINRGTGAIQVVSVYRDLYTEIDGKGTYHKLNEAYFRGGPKQAISALERNLDVDIEGYVTFNWKAVIDGINILGGVDVEITEPEFKYINSFITETVIETGVGSVQLEHAGMNHLDGVQAVAYARLRLMDTDFKRTERQRTVLKLAFEKAKKADFSVLQQLVFTILPQTSTNLAVDDLLPFAKDVKKYYLAETTGFPFELSGAIIKKMDVVVPVTLKSNVVKLHSFLYGDQTPPYMPSQTMKEISAHIVKVSGKGKSDDAEVEIKPDKSNSGNGNSNKANSSKGNSDKGNSNKTEPKNSSSNDSLNNNNSNENSSIKETVSTENNNAETTTPEIQKDTEDTSVNDNHLQPSIQDSGDENVPDAPTAGAAPAGDKLDDDSGNGPGV